MNKAGVILTIVILGVIAGLVYFNHPTNQTTNPLDVINPTPTTNPLVAEITNGLGTQSAVITPGATTTQSVALSPITPTTAQTLNLKATQAIIMTTKGEIDLRLFPNDAPITVANFVQKANSGFYKNLTFHRVEDWVVQGGDPLGNGTGGETMLTELNKKPFIVGSLGVARGADINVSNDSQFFITKTDASWLNTQYTNFGIVTKGIDVVQKIEIGDKILNVATQ